MTLKTRDNNEGTYIPQKRIGPSLSFSGLKTLGSLLQTSLQRQTTHEYMSTVRKLLSIPQSPTRCSSNIPLPLPTSLIIKPFSSSTRCLSQGHPSPLMFRRILLPWARVHTLERFDVKTKNHSAPGVTWPILHLYLAPPRGSYARPSKIISRLPTTCSRVNIFSCSMSSHDACRT